MKKALLVARLEHDARKFKEDLVRRGYAVTHVASIEEGRALVRRPHQFEYVSIGGCECTYQEALEGILFREEPRRVSSRRKRAA